MWRACSTSSRASTASRFDRRLPPSSSTPTCPKARASARRRRSKPRRWRRWSRRGRSRSIPGCARVRCQQVENLIVGAPCGVMDQMATICGEAGSLMALLCQPAEFQGTVRLPDELGVWGIDSGIRHAVTGADYGAVRVGAFMGYRILAELAGLRVTPGERRGARAIEDDPRWHGYLANVGPRRVRAASSRPSRSISTATSSSRAIGGTTDLVTRVDPRRTLRGAPRRRASRLRARARDGVGAAACGGQRPMRLRLGALMYESHASYSACGLGSEGTDRLVALAQRGRPPRGHLWREDHRRRQRRARWRCCAHAAAGDVVRAIAGRYARQRPGATPTCSKGVSPGAAAVGAASL